MSVGFLEKFLVSLSAIAIGMWWFRLPMTPVLLLFGTQGLALYYLCAFPFRKSFFSRKRTWLKIVFHVFSGLVLALGLHALLLFALGWIQRNDLMGNACILLALLTLVHGIVYWKQREAFSFGVALRALILLVVLFCLAWCMQPFQFL